MAVGTTRQAAPTIWPHRKVDPVFLPPLQVEVWDGTQYVLSPIALLKLTDGQDRTFVSGRLRLTFPTGPLVLLGRARGDPSRTTLDGAPLTPTWLGLDSAVVPPKLPRGWHPWTARIQQGGVLLLDTAGLKLSALSAHALSEA